MEAMTNAGRTRGAGLGNRRSDSVSINSTSDNGEVDSAGAATGAAEPQTLPPELAKIVAAWPTLPIDFKRAMLALVDAG